MSSIDNIQDRIESLTVSLFEAARSYGEKDEVKRVAMIENVKREYSAAVENIDTLLGASRNVEEQEMEMNELSAMHSRLKDEILQLQQKLNELDSTCKNDLKDILNDPLCNCERS